METKTQETPLMIRLDKARNELRFAVNNTATKYDLPGYLLDMTLEGILAEERLQRISLMSEQISFDYKDKESED